MQWTETMIGMKVGSYNGYVKEAVVCAKFWWRINPEPSPGHVTVSLCVLTLVTLFDLQNVFLISFT